MHATYSLTTALSSGSRYLCSFLFHPSDSLPWRIGKIAGLIFATVCLRTCYKKFQATDTASTKPSPPPPVQPSPLEAEIEEPPLPTQPGPLKDNIETLLLTPHILKDMPHANRGKIAVYFPTQFPMIVLKEAGYDCESRLKQMEVARNICKEIENGSTLLVIPQSLGVANEQYLIEERLPLQHINDLAQQELYCQHQKELGPTIHAMTHFILRSHLGDLIAIGNGFPRGYRSPRYDNIPFFMTSKGIRIGLTDLQYMKEASKEPQIGTLATLVYIYPYHKDTILKAAASYFSQDQLTSIAETLNDQEKKGRELLRICYWDLQAHLENHRGRKISISREIKQAIIKEIDAEIKTSSPENGMILTPEEKKDISNILDEIVEVLNEIKTRGKGPAYRFNTAAFDKIENTLSYYEFERTLFPRKILKGDGTNLTYYLLQKLEKHRAIYGCSIVGSNATLVD